MINRTQNPQSLCNIPRVAVFLSIGIGLAQPGFAQMGIGLMGGVQRLPSPLTQETSSRGRFEGEFFSSGLLDGRLELGLAFGLSSLGSTEESYVTYQGNTTYVDTYEDRCLSYDIRLNARLYPLSSSDSVIHPYLGGGFGYFWMNHHWQDTYTETIDYGVYADTWEDVYEGHSTLAKGFFSYLGLGLDIPLYEHTTLNLEYRHDFHKVDNGWDLGGSIFMAGLRLRM